VLTPVAQLQPVIVGGVTVRNAVLHNEQVVNQKGAYPGAKAIVQRAGDVIPEVVRVLDPHPGWKMPECCPVCGRPVLREEPYIAHRCINPFCPAQRLERLRHFASRPALDIAGLGPAVLAQLLERKLVNDPADLYRLTQEQLEGLDRLAEKSAQKLIQQIEGSRNPPLSRFLYALGIPQIGSATADLLAAHFGDLAAIRQAEEDQLVEVEGVGANMAEGISTFFASQGGELIDRLIKVGVKPQAEERAANSELSGKTVVFTGSMERMSRQEAEELVRKLGGRASSNISARTDYVVAGPGAGTKLEKARELKLNVLEEAEFFDLLGLT
ncbi:MAG: helix-hairpin-helix domain-containing protein, partial [Candidatus Dormibacteraceae bacterium]